MFDDEPATVPGPGAAAATPAGPLATRPHPPGTGPGLRLALLPRPLRQHRVWRGLHGAPGLCDLPRRGRHHPHLLHLPRAGFLRRAQI